SSVLRAYCPVLRRLRLYYFNRIIYIGRQNLVAPHKGDETMEMMTGGATLARTLRAAGVEEVFALHGGHLDAFLIACAEHGIRLTDTRHEASAGHAAEAYARATGRIGVAAVTAGPGFNQARTATANAHPGCMPGPFI